MARQALLDERGAGTRKSQQKDMSGDVPGRAMRSSQQRIRRLGDGLAQALNQFVKAARLAGAGALIGSL